ncbi:hypothetical protein RHODO2019_18675 (plasmid) [Rhodococcus antarcticus]|jgi:hypothetical protein|uniref:TrbC/VIRB2 family protein n=1 Tax=Rhodococcus antarcticus TaxID=2987751 RepID=A0ABY6P5U5_9NOCA|nr:hypothetical protein [Rhodococcus antarcticus]UZJ27017.1 hypothetical protein RHODO2019_18675 [Rhodococcus antarcticus]
MATLSTLRDTLVTELYLGQSGITVTPERPPGTDGLVRLINYVAWGAFAICLVGFIIAAATMGIKHSRGEDLPGMKGIALSLLGTVLIGSAGAIVGSVTN